MISYELADGYKDAFRLAAEDDQWNKAERREMLAIAEDDDNTGQNWGSGRRFRHGRMTFLAHIAAAGINIGRCD